MNLDYDCNCDKCNGEGDRVEEHQPECCCELCHDLHNYSIDYIFCEQCEENRKEEASL